MVTWLALTALVLILFFSGCANSNTNSSSGGGTIEQACVNSGGTVITSSCCQSVSDFPNTCGIGACGCSPANSHSVRICVCSNNKCFDGYSCS
jgi:hypothetical protein